MPYPDVTLNEQQRALMPLLSQPLTGDEIAERAGISRAWVYKLLASMREAGAVVMNDELWSGQSPVTFSAAHPQGNTTNPYPAKVTKAEFRDPHDGSLWQVQGALLDRWDGKRWPDAVPDSRAVVVAPPTRNPVCWVASRRVRVPTSTIERHWLPGALTHAQAYLLTLAVAGVLEQDALMDSPPRTGIEKILDKAHN